MPNEHPLLYGLSRHDSYIVFTNKITKTLSAVKLIKSQKLLPSKAKNSNFPIFLSSPSPTPQTLSIVIYILEMLTTFDKFNNFIVTTKFQLSKVGLLLCI